MQTIEDLKVEKTFYRNEKDLNGQVYREPYQAEVKRKVQTVSQGIRFGYFVIDLILILLLQFASGIVIGIFAPDIVLSDSFVLDIIGWLIFFLYYFVLEATTGATVGKMLLGYTVIDAYAHSVDSGTAALRTICRFIPFEAFSCFSDRGWHDLFSKTYVVSKAELNKLRELLDGFSNDPELID